ncbi:MAG: c-type cytochrome domain-containing protein [Planctomycetota bacterium]
MMKHLHAHIILLALSVTLSHAVDVPEFAKDVAPLLAKHCLSCHGPNDPDGGLVLERHASLLKGGESGAAILPGKSSASLLVRLIESHDKTVMPPGKRKKLDAAEITTIKSWIDAGALPPKVDNAIGSTGGIPKIKPKVPPKKPILAIAESIPAKLVAIARRGDVELRDAGTLALKFKLPGHTGAVNSVAFSKDGKILACVAGTAGVAGEIKLWNTSDGKILKSWAAHTDAIYSVALSPDGKTLATGSYDQKILLWNVADVLGGKEPAAPRVLSGHNGAIFSLAFRPDGKILASASGDRTAKLWDVATGNRLDTLSQPLKEQYVCVFSPNGSHLIAGGGDNRIRLWKIGETALDGSNPLQEAAFAHDGAVLKLAYSPDGKTIYSSGEDRAVKSWNADKVSQKSVFDSQPDWVTGLSVSADGKSLLLGRIDGSFAEIDAMSGKVLKPDLTAISPRSIQRGVETTIKLSGKNLIDLSAIKFSSPKIKVGAIVSESKNDITLRITAEATMPRGSTDVFVVNAAGESTKLALYVDDLPQAFDRDPLASMAALRETNITLPASLNGDFKNPGDSGVFHFDAKAGQTIVFDAATAAIKSKARVTLSVVGPDTKPLIPLERDMGVEPLLAFKIPVDGRYTARIDEATLAATKDHFYRMSVGEFAYVTSFYPLAVPARAESTIQLRGYNMPQDFKAHVKATEPGDATIPLDLDKFRTRSGLKALAIDVPQIKEIEPNNTPAQATAMSAPGAAEGCISAPEGKGTDEDFYRFESPAGKQWIIETVAAKRGSPVDTKIDILDAQGKPIPRLQLLAVRDSYINFRPIDSAGLGVRLKNWEEMELTNFIYLQGEVCRLFQAPRGPDADSIMFKAANGARRTYFDTSATSHANEDTVYVVEPHPPGEKLIPNGLPIFTLNYSNDDDGNRRLGSDSHLSFTAPKDGSYLVRVTDARAASGDQFVYHLVIREPKPAYTVKFTMDPSTINAGSGKGFTLTADRIDGFDGDIRVDIAGMPPGFSVSTPVVIQAGHFEAFGTIAADESAHQPTEAELAAITVKAVATVSGQPVEKMVSGLPKLKLEGKPKLIVMLEPVASSLSEPLEHKPLDITLVPGQTVPVSLKVRRNGHDDLITFTIDNLPHGVIVDNIGLSGVLLEKGLNERQIFLSAERWVPETDRLCHAVENQAGRQTSRPVMLHIRRATK